MVEYISGLDVIPFTVSSSYDNLNPYAESQAQHEYDQIIDAGNGRGAQFQFADSTQKGRVGHSYDLLDYCADQYREGNPQDFAV